MPRFALALVAGFICTHAASAQVAVDRPPQALDARLVVELFAKEPDIVHPVSIDFDHKGRLLVIESHTHFRPANYQGPATDRIRIALDTDGDGKADRFTTFHEGLTHTMDLAVHPDGSVYVATRNEILRLRDTKGSDKADDVRRIAFLDTAGNYPHNGLSGLCFDSRGDLYFGMGENLGARYELIGSDGKKIGGEGDGGHLFWCKADGSGLRKVATGFWNPFGMCRDIFGRIYAVDNDPDARPPCRMMHVVEGADYGFQFCYGRSGRHPFQSWNGELPGTLPMVAGTGEAPCEILSYESDGLPSEYRGDLLVASWADHRIERYVPRAKGASFTAERKPFVQGGKDFRPVGLATAPDGSLYLSDWVLRDYTLHGKGALWRIRIRDTKKVDRPSDPKQGLFSAAGTLRETSAKQLAQSETGRDLLRQQLAKPADVRTQAASLQGLIDAADVNVDLGAIADRSPEMGLREMAVAEMARRGQDVSRFVDLKTPSLARVAIATSNDVPRLLGLLTDADPFLAHAAAHRLGSAPGLLAKVDLTKVSDAKQLRGLLIAHRHQEKPNPEKVLPIFMQSKDHDVRLLTAKWIADEKLIAFRKPMEAALAEPGLNLPTIRAYLTTLGRLNNKAVNEGQLVGLTMAQVQNLKNPPAFRALALQGIPAKQGAISLEQVGKLLDEPDQSIQHEAARLLSEYADAKRYPMLKQIATDESRSEAVRAQAIVGLADKADAHAQTLMELAQGPKGIVRQEALRALIGVPLSDVQKPQLASLADKDPTIRDSVQRLFDRPFAGNRPGPKDLDAWAKKLEGPADVAAGRRVFAHPKLAGCVRCHRVEGRGSDIGPDLSTIGQVERRALLESILQPSNNVAPHFQVWALETVDGKIRIGLLTHTHLDESTYLDEKGETFKVLATDLVEARAVPRSLMPDQLLDRLTDQEIRDLVAYLASLK